MTLRDTHRTDGTLEGGRCALSLAEFALGAAIVIGHNVFHRVPNEVPLLVILGTLSFLLRNGGWGAAGLRRPASWPRVLLWGLLGAILIQAGGELVLPLALRIWPQPVEMSTVFTSLKGNLPVALKGLVLVWVFAAFGEELSYRGYLGTRAMEALGGSRTAKLAALAAVSVLFGFGHFYKGPAGVVESTWSGLVLGSVYLASGGNLWAAILAHGISDTFAVVAVFAGWAN